LFGVHNLRKSLAAQGTSVDSLCITFVVPDKLGISGDKNQGIPSNPHWLLVVILIVLTALYKVILIAIPNNQQPLISERLLII